jgi:hypothetical protein
MNAHIGSQLGSALGTGLEHLTQQKMQSIAEHKAEQQRQRQLNEQQQKVSGLASLFEQGGFDQKTSALLAQLETNKPGIAKDLMGLLGQGGYGNNQEQSGLSSLQQMTNVPQEMTEEGASYTPYEPYMQEQQKRSLPKQQKLVEEGIPNEPKNLAESIAQGKQKQIDAAAQKEADKETKEWFNTTLKEEKAAVDNDRRLDKMLKLIDKGKLPNAAVWKFLTDIEDVGVVGAGGAGAAVGGALGNIPGAAIGGVIGGLISPLAGLAKSSYRAWNEDVEEFEKLSADFIKGAKAVFGTRITDADLNAYMKTIPTLMQSDAGKKRVIANLQEINAFAKKQATIAREIVKANGNRRPADLEQQVQDRMSEDLDVLAAEFKIS